MELTVQQLPGSVYPCIHCVIGESAIRGQPWVSPAYQNQYTKISVSEVLETEEDFGWYIAKLISTP